MADATREEAFEVEIAEYLAERGWLYSPNADGYDRERALFPADVFAWLEETQPEEFAKVVSVGAASEPKERARLLDTLVKRLDTKMEHGGGTLNVLRRPFSHINAKFRMCQFAPATTLNPKTAADYAAVRLRVMRQVTYSPNGGGGRIDLVFFVNGLPVATLELKTYFKQQARSAIEQYRKDRDPNGQPLLAFGRTLVHFAVDDDEVWMTTKLARSKTFFLPFNKGTLDGGKGNPPNPSGPATSYLWEEVLERRSWLNILGSLMFLRHEENTDPITGKTSKKTTLIFPRYHQWDAVRKLVSTVGEEGPGARYLVQHSAGSGKTNTIAWTAHRLARMHTAENKKMFDKVLVISDRRVLDRQLQDAVRQVDNTAHLVTTIDDAEVRRAGGSKSKALAAALSGNSLIVIVTIQTFPFVMDLLTGELAGKNFAVIADEAHTSQSGSTVKELRKVLTAGDVEVPEGEEFSAEDVLNAKISAMTAARAEPKNISYLAFTATPKSKTLTTFGRRDPADPDAKPKAFHVYTMRQAIEEGFILDVLRGYQSYKTAFEIEERAGAHELVDSKAAARGIMRFVKLHEINIGQKVEIIVEHFLANVAHLLEGHAKAMVVTDSRVAAVRYKRAIDEYISRKKYGLKTIVAFSGVVNDSDYGIVDESEKSMNPGLKSDLAAEFRRSDYRVMIVADKFQTGFDQPLLCAMYVDKKLPDVHAVQTLSRLNRTYRTPNGEQKDTTFVLDFVNEPADIQDAFEPYYTEARVERETDPNIVHEIVAKLAVNAIYTWTEVEEFATAWFSGGSHAELAAAVKPAKDRFATRYETARATEDREEQDRLELFRKDASTFVRMYDFMSQVIDYGDTDLEKLSVYLRQLVRVIEIDRVSAEVDLSDLMLKRVKQIDRGKVSITLGTHEVALPGIGGAGSGDVNQDPNLVRLTEVIERINDLFGGELGPEEIESFVKPVAAKAEEAPGIADQIDNNAKDQFLESVHVKNAIIDAAFDIEAAVGKLSRATMADDLRAAQLTRIIGEYMWETRHEAPSKIPGLRGWEQNLHIVRVGPTRGEVDAPAEPDQIISVDAYLVTADMMAAERVAAALDNLASFLGYSSPFEEEIYYGSIWRRAKGWIRAGIKSSDVQDRLVKIERAIEIKYLDARQAEADFKSAEAVSKIVDSLDGISEACLKVGSILIVKHPAQGGDPQILVRNLSQLEMRAFERFPEIQKNPRKTLDALAAAAASIEISTDLDQIP
ncbi:type I restriction endonuclease [Saccharopolyspora sp. NPDC002686]|uniref:type I restriction endonuclease subunit R n=1 Tax=Saccharopolyspora sp. NPDC002686 TaxID=3154541 RepID=UPI00332CA115